MADRRETLKILGAISSTCAFPFLGDELYAQHAHGKNAVQAVATAPKFFSPVQFSLVSRIADLIIPPTDTPGAVAAGVPAYIDLVVGRNKPLQESLMGGLRWIDDESTRQFGHPFLKLTEEQQIALLEPLDERRGTGVGERFFRAIKNLTADGYYTSKIGLMDELGYNGNTVLAEFPSCEVPEH